LSGSFGKPKGTWSGRYRLISRIIAQARSPSGRGVGLRLWGPGSVMKLRSLVAVAALVFAGNASAAEPIN